MHHKWSITKVTHRMTAWLRYGQIVSPTDSTRPGITDPRPSLMCHCIVKIEQVRLLFRWLPHAPTMLMAASSSHSATHPAPTCPACLAKLSAAAALSIFPSRMPESSTGPQPAMLMLFSGQQILPKVPLSMGQSSPKGETTCYPQGLPPCQISLPCVNPH